MVEPRVAGSLWSVPHHERLQRAVSAARDGLGLLHWDVADGALGPAGGFSPQEARQIALAAGVRSEAHLMVANPLEHVDSWASWCEVVVVHLESHDWQAALARIATHGSLGGVAVSPQTHTSLVPDSASAVLVMSVEPGHAGSPFSLSALPRLSGLVSSSTPPRFLGLDGGVKRAHALSAGQAGANWLVSGTDLFGAHDVGEWIAECTAALTP